MSGMDIDIIWDYLIATFIFHLVIIILVSPLFVFFPETHVFLYGILYFIVQVYNIALRPYLCAALNGMLRITKSFLRSISAFFELLLPAGLQDKIWRQHSRRASVTTSEESTEIGSEFYICKVTVTKKTSRRSSGKKNPSQKAKAKPDGKQGRPKFAESEPAPDSSEDFQRSHKKVTPESPTRETARKVSEAKSTISGDESSQVIKKHHKLSEDIEWLNQINVTDSVLNINFNSDTSKELQILKQNVEAPPEQQPQSPLSILSPTPVDLTPSQLSQEDASGSARSIDYSVLNNFYHFTVDENGGRLKLPFCTLFFPMMAVVAEKLLKIAAVYKKANRKDHLTQVIPAIHCSKSDSDSYDAVEFDKPVHFDVATVADWTDEDIEIQVTENSTQLDWRQNEDINVTRTCNSISFYLSRFAGVRAVVQQPVLDLYHCVYMKRPAGILDPAYHHFYILLYSGDRDMRKTASRTLSSPANEVLVERHHMLVRPPFTFKATLSIPSTSSTPPQVSFDITPECLKIQENLFVKIAKFDRTVAIDSADSVPLEYKIFSSSCARSIFAPFYWNAPVLSRSVSIASVKSLTVNAIGEQSVGVLVLSQPPSPKVGRKPGRWGSEHAFREHLLPPILRDHSAPDLFNQSSSESDSAESTQTDSYSDLSYSTISTLEHNPQLQFDPTSTPSHSPIVSGQMRFASDLSPLDKRLSLRNPNTTDDSGIYF